MTAAELVNNLRFFCAQNANADNVAKYSRYFKTELVAYGLTQPQVNAKAKELSKESELNLDSVFEAIPQLFSSGMYEEISLGLLLIDNLHKQFSPQTFFKCEKLYSIGIDNWAHADMMGMYILPKLMTKKMITISDFKNWLIAENKFQRRSVPVTFIKSLKNNRNADFTSYFFFIEILMTDKDREVHQGVGWFLREAWKIQPFVTEDFLMKWKDSAARLIINYATEKMDKSSRLKFRKENTKH
jgi:3-methyladenine DNA glycosylase AlkD